jgi:hypothetical protein
MAETGSRCCWRQGGRTDLKEQMIKIHLKKLQMNDFK